MIFGAGKPTIAPIAFASLFVLAPHLHGAQVITQDLLVQGSIGLGIDIGSSQSFGFDTIRLKENNLRIHFDDTSASGSFAANDWRIVINDSDNGGANYFAIEDSTANKQVFRVDAGAPANSLRISKEGRAGIGTASPVVPVHVVHGNTPTMRLEQNGSSGFTAQTWDLASNETNFFIRDTTNGSKLPFRIKPGAPNNSIMITADGDLGFGIETPKAKVHIPVDGNTTGVYVGPHDDEADYSATLNVKGTMFVSETLEIGSSRTRKEKIRQLGFEEAMETLEALEPVEFHYLKDPESQLGFIAEDVPDSVATAKRKSVRPMDFVAVLTRVVQEQSKREQALQNELSDQAAQIEALEKRLEELELRK